MPDISKCANEKCKLKLKCYRYTSESNPFRQTYGCFSTSVINGKNICEMFIKNSKK